MADNPTPEQVKTTGYVNIFELVFCHMCETRVLKVNGPCNPDKCLNFIKHEESQKDNS